MADVTVNIRGNASQLRNEIDGLGGGGSSPVNQPAPPSPIGHSSAPTGGSLVPSNDRMVEDVRREMQQRGVLMVPGSASMSQIINQYGQNQRNGLNDRITDKYSNRRADLQHRLDSDYDDVERRAEERRKDGLNRLGKNANDPLALQYLDKSIEEFKEREYRKVGMRYDDDSLALDEEEKNERISSEQELTKAIQELTEYFNRQSDNNGNTVDSYIGRLRAQQQSLIQERDNSDSEEGASEAQRKLAAVNEELRRVMSGGESQQGGYGDSLLRGSQGIMGLASGLQNGDISSTIMGGSSAIAGLSGMGMKAAMRFMGWAVLAAGGAKMLSGTSDTYEAMGDLASIRATSDGKKGGDASSYLNAVIPNAIFAGASIANFGLSAEQFAAEAAKRTKARGMGDDWFNETMRQIGLEKNFSLTAGSLQQGGKYDRYGTNVTDAITRLVTVLSGIEGSGVSDNDFSRVQEKFDIQQSIMGSYLERTDKPQYDTANQMLAAFSAVSGVTQDSRTGSDIQSFQNMIQNPINERMKALVYSSVADLFPETGSRMDLIDRAIRDPKNEGKIMQSVIKRITDQFGGTDTQMGYFAFKRLFPNVAPERLDEYIKQLSSGEGAGNLLANGITNQSEINNYANSVKDEFAVESIGYLSKQTQLMQTMSNYVKDILGKITGTNNSPQPNTTKGGGNK